MVKFSRIVFIAMVSLGFSNRSLFAPETVLIDVRTPEEYQQDHIADTPNLPHTVIATQIADLGLSKSTPIKLFCRSGVRAGLALAELESLGYTNVENIGGIADARERLAE